MAQSDSLDDGHGHGSPWSSTSFQIATLFLIVLAVVGIAIAIFHHGSHHHAGAGNVPPSTHVGNAPSTTTTASTARGGLCSLPAGNQQVPSASYPQGVMWQGVGSVSVPQSSTFGPQHVQNGINVCFAHNPSGALLAALNLMGELSTEISERRVVDELSIDVPQGVTTAPAANDWQHVQIAGYKYDSYSSTDAVLEVVLRHDEGGLSAVQTPMRWTGNDWKYVFPPDGPIVSTLNGAEVEPPYVAWGAFS